MPSKGWVPLFVFVILKDIVTLEELTISNMWEVVEY